MRLHVAYHCGVDRAMQASTSHCGCNDVISGQRTGWDIACRGGHTLSRLYGKGTLSEKGVYPFGSRGPLFAQGCLSIAFPGMVSKVGEGPHHPWLSRKSHSLRELTPSHPPSPHPQGSPVAIRHTPRNVPGLAPRSCRILLLGRKRLESSQKLATIHERLTLPNAHPRTSTPPRVADTP